MICFRVVQVKLRGVGEKNAVLASPQADLCATMHLAIPRHLFRTVQPDASAPRQFGHSACASVMPISYSSIDAMLELETDPGNLLRHVDGPCTGTR
jgi:hypothetical protein